MNISGRAHHIQEGGTKNLVRIVPCAFSMIQFYVLRTIDVGSRVPCGSLRNMHVVERHIIAKVKAMVTCCEEGATRDTLQK